MIKQRMQDEHDLLKLDIVLKTQKSLLAAYSLYILNRV